MNHIETTSVARRIVETNMYMTIATADADGRPWVSPVWFAPRYRARAESQFVLGPGDERLPVQVGK